MLNNMDISQKLLEAGLTRNEAKVYLELLEKGESSANQIAKNLSMDRTLTYTILNHLIKKGQVRYIVKENKKRFSCSNPENLLNPIKAKELLVSELIKDLKKIETKKQEEIEINVYEGKEGIRNFINLVLKEKEFFSFGSTGRAFYQLYEMPAIVKIIEKSKIKVKIIGNEKHRGSEAFGFKKFEYKYLNSESEATTSIFGDYISIHLIKNKPAIILIKNKNITETYKNYFKVLWKIAKS